MGGKSVFPFAEVLQCSFEYRFAFWRSSPYSSFYFWIPLLSCVRKRKRNAATSVINCKSFINCLRVVLSTWQFALIFSPVISALWRLWIMHWIRSLFCSLRDVRLNRRGQKARFFMYEAHDIIFPLSITANKELWVTFCDINYVKEKKNSVAVVRKWTIPTELPPLVGEISAS
jgi:hypothetical protein